MSSVPYVYGYLRQSSTERFTGIVFNVVDTAQYFAWMRAFSASLLIENPLTPDAGAARFFNLQWWPLGVVAYQTALGPVATYQLFRIVALAGFVIALALFCRLVIPRHALLAFAVVMLSSGLGWILVVVKQWTGTLAYPLDVQVAEANTFFSAMAFPHLLFAAALLLGIYLCVLLGVGPKRLRYSALAGVLTLILGFSHGYDLLLAVVIPAAFIMARFAHTRHVPEHIWPVGAILAGSGPPGLYLLSLTRLDPTWNGVLSQYDNAGVYTPSPPHLLILLGLPFLLAMWQLRPDAWRQLTHPQLFVRAWFIAGFALLYIPTDFQIKMLTAYQVPVGILATQTLVAIAARVHLALSRVPQVRATVIVGTLAFLMLTNIYLTSWRVVELRRADYPFYLTAADVQALTTLEDIATPGSVVLSSTEIGIFVPVYSDARPFVAHWAQTLDFFERRDSMRWFFSSESTEADRLEFIRHNQIAFVIAGKAETRVGAPAAPASDRVAEPAMSLPSRTTPSPILYGVGTENNVGP
ncbi:MAG TPA: hypothetical protein VMM78_16945 [Thermomicrobiales bacterium]|nr:hypothetical protein [Thermomicrobiales bacterium]